MLKRGLFGVILDFMLPWDGYIRIREGKGVLDTRSDFFHTIPQGEKLEDGTLQNKNH